MVVASDQLIYYYPNNQNDYQIYKLHENPLKLPTYASEDLNTAIALITDNYGNSQYVKLINYNSDNETRLYGEIKLQKYTQAPIRITDSYFENTWSIKWHPTSVDVLDENGKFHQ